MTKGREDAPLQDKMLPRLRGIVDVVQGITFSNDEQKQVNTDWHMAELKQLANFIDYRGKTPPKQSSGIPLVTAKIIKNNMIQEPHEFIHGDYYNQWMTRGIPNMGDVVFTTEAPLGEVAVIKTSDKLAFAQRIIVMQANQDILDGRFLFYSLQHPKTKDRIAAKSSGTTVVGIKSSELKKVKIDYPALPEQRAIAATLSCLDDKIENNSKINHHLEQMAQAIYKSWFVDFEPWGGKRPSDWQEGTLGQFVEIKRGGSPRPIQDFLSDTGYRWLKISDVTSLQTPFVLKIKEHIKESGLNKTVFRKANTLVLSNSATPGIPKILGVDTCIHDGWLYFPTSKFSNEYLYLFFTNIRQDLVALGNGSVFTNLKTGILKSFPVVFPGEDVLRQFDKIMGPIFRGIENCTRESTLIATLRDILLPRLMSGELPVADLAGK